MSSRDTFDLVVIGGGPGGHVAAGRAAELGLRVALVERREFLGGTCLNEGCIPSKALLVSSELFETAGRDLGDHGIVSAPAELDLGRMMARKARIVRDLAEGIRSMMKRSRVAVFCGKGRLAGAGRVAVEGEEGERELRAEWIVLATGGAPVELPSLPFDGDRVASSAEALAFDRVPARLVVVGAGAVGLELGSIWNRLGSRVTVIDVLPRVLPFADHQVSRFLKRSLERQGLDFRLGRTVLGAEICEGGLDVVLRDESGREETVPCDRLLVAVGRRPLTEGVGLEEAGVEVGAGGRIEVDDHFRTTAAGVYAIGDLVRGPMLAHKASEEGLAVAEEVSGRGIGGRRIDPAAIPNVVYTRPEAAQVGLTEEELKEQDLPYEAGRAYFKANGRARCMGAEEEGLVKVLAHRETGRLLGVHVLGPCASELIGWAVPLVRGEGKVEDLVRAVPAHPTLSEVLREAAWAVGRRRPGSRKAG